MERPQEERISIRINGKEKFLLSDVELNHEIAATKEGNFENINSIVLEDQVVEDFIEEAGPNNVIDFEKRWMEKNNKKHKIKRKIKTFTPLDGRKIPILSKKKRKHLPLVQKKKPKVSNVKKIVATILSAVLVGTGLGYIVLSLFTDITEVKSEGGKLSQNGQAIQQPVQATPTAVAPSTQKQAIVDGDRKMEAMVIKPLEFNVIQGGAFASVESANKYATNIKESGAAAVIVPNSNPVLMFIGIGIDRNELESVSNYYQEKGQEIYLKPIEIGGLNKSKLKSGEVAYIASGQALYQSLIKLSTQTFETKTINESSWKEIAKKFGDWNRQKPANLSPSMQQFAKSTTEAYQALSTYRSKQNERQLWKSQQSLLNGLLSYQKWLAEND